MKNIVNSYIDKLKTGRKQSYRNLAVYPLLSTCEAGIDYLLFSEALLSGMIEITELDESGSVPEFRRAQI